MDKLTYFSSIKNTRDSLPQDRRETFDVQLAGREKSPTVALVLSLFIGTLGIDRFYLGSILLGILKLVTLGGFGIWAFIDWFLIMGAARKKNVEIASQVRAQLA
jgi:TM2 domain-containing membrane protein YozV